MFKLLCILSIAVAIAHAHPDEDALQKDAVKPVENVQVLPNSDLEVIAQEPVPVVEVEDENLDKAESAWGWGGRYYGGYGRRFGGYGWKGYGGFGGWGNRYGYGWGGYPRYYGW